MGMVHRLVVVADGTTVGTVSWHRTAYGPNTGSQAWNIGIGLAPSSRGLGVGSLAQRLLAEHLFDTTPAHRVEASTDVDNTAEHRALGKAGFVQEGVARGAQYRADGRHHDLAVYAVLRGELAPARAADRAGYAPLISRRTQGTSGTKATPTATAARPITAKYPANPMLSCRRTA